MSSTENLLEATGLVVRYGAVTAVDGVSLALPRHRLTTLVGPSGCGKTTFLRAIAGFERPRQGSVALDGETLSDAATWVPPERRQIGMVFQEGALFPHLTVGDNVAYGLYRLDRDERRRRVARSLERVGMTELLGRFPDELSGGQQQRVALARALAPEPRLVLLDEPFASLDATLRDRLRQEVRRILAAAGVTALLVTHDQEEALSVADQVAVMSAGKILQVGSADDVYHRPASPAVAGFIGDGALLPCRVSGGRVECLLGAVETEAADGPGQIFVRPEDLGVEVCSDPAAAHGTIIERSFFGHDVLDRVRLVSGDEVTVRVLSSMAPPEGARVRLELRSRAFTLFPSPEAGARAFSAAVEEA